MPYSLQFRLGAVEALEQLDSVIARRVQDKLRWLAEHFEEVTPQPLTGTLRGFYRLRVGSYRVVYEIDRATRTLIVQDVGHRSEAYR